jgi:cytoskeletal protein RodZ
MDDFGGKLRQARERRGISLRQIAASTKISAAALDALERNDISKLPGGIFSRSFVRSYALEVGLDPDETVREFVERFNQETAATERTVAAEVPEEEREFQERQRRAARIAGAAIAVLVIVIVGAVFAYRARAARSRAQEQRQMTQDGAVVAPSQPAPAAAEQPAARADTGRPSSPLPAQDKDKDKAPAVPGQLRLEIRPTSACWVSVTADGKKLFARLMTAGQLETVVIAREATIEIGDAGAFAYTINDKPGKPLGDRGQVKTLRLTPATAGQFTR